MSIVVATNVDETNMVIYKDGRCVYATSKPINELSHILFVLGMTHTFFTKCPTYTFPHTLEEFIEQYPFHANVTEVST